MTKGRIALFFVPFSLKNSEKGGIHLGNNLKGRMINYNINGKEAQEHYGTARSGTRFYRKSFILFYNRILQFRKGKKDYAEWQKQRQFNIKNQKNVAPL